MIQNLEQLKASGRIALECVAGSRMYGINRPDSDEDIKGMYILPFSDIDCIHMLSPPDEVKNKSEDIKYFELKKFMDLMSTCNPNMLDLLWIPQDCIRISTPAHRWLVERRSIFLSRRAVGSFIGYSRDQVNKAQGQNKMVNHPAPVEPPKKEDFCYLIPDWKAIECGTLKLRDYKMPFRPISIAEVAMADAKKLNSPLDLSKCYVSSVEHLPTGYRLYNYTDKDDCKGVFRGDGMLACESISIEDERRCIGMLIYNVDGFNKAHKDWKRYWEWRSKRNEARWVGQDGEKFRYDRKNMSHCIRLLYAGIATVRDGVPLVRLEGEMRDYVMRIRNGDFEYDDIIKKSEELTAELQDIEKTSCLPETPDYVKIDQMLKELRSEVDKHPEFWLNPNAPTGN